MARQNLGKLLQQVDGEGPAEETPARPVVALERPTEVPQEQSAPKAAATKPAAKSTSARNVKKSPRTPRTEPKQGPRTEGARYWELERKEARLRVDQYEALGTIARRLQRQKTSVGERITENTLIRVAIDLPLAREADLAGETEDEIRNSVSL